MSILNWLQRKPETLGARGERLALRALRRAGYRIIARNVHIGRYEIDIIARDGDTTVFVEVKTRREQDEIAPEENVRHEKRRRLRQAARVYMERERDPAMYYRFDVVAVHVPDSGKPSTEIYRDAFAGRE